MAVRRNTKNRLTLFRVCQTCGKSFVTTADSPFMRQMPVEDKKQAICYFCSESCKEKSYKHHFDGKAEERRKEREKKRDISEKNKKYYWAHVEEMRKRRMDYYWANHEQEKLNNAYQKKKRKLKNMCEVANEN